MILFSDGVVMTNLLPSDNPLEHILIIFNVTRGRIAIEMIKSQSHSKITSSEFDVTSMLHILLLGA